MEVNYKQLARVYRHICERTDYFRPADEAARKPFRSIYSAIVTAEIQGVDMAAMRAEVCALISWTILRSSLDYTPSEAEQWEFLNAYYEI